MKKGQTSKRGGFEDILFPMQVCNITQGDKVGTHAATYAVDLAGKDAGRDNAYMPFTGVIKAIDSPQNGNALFIESVGKKRFADGSIDYATIMFIHDNERTGWAVGKVFKQGEQIYTEGTSGNANGNHIHFEVAKGKFSHMYDLNSYGVYHLPNNIPVEKACFMDGTTIKQGVAKWKYLKDVPVSNKPDQILKVGEYFKITGIHRVDQVLKDMNSIWCEELTGNGGNSIQAGPLIKCDKNGKKTDSQVFKVGDYFKCDQKFKVLDVDKTTNAVQAEIGGRKIWLFAGPLTEL